MTAHRSNPAEDRIRVTALAGGIGASKFLLGLCHVIPPEDVTIIANAGDDIELFGLRICPDIDTIVYTLSGLVDRERGWGVSGDRFECLEMLSRYGEAAWFNLGDRDLATHIFRSERLRRGASLTEVTAEIAEALGVRARVLPMTDSYTPTRIVTDEGEMHFQEYFVRRRCEPRVREVRFDNIEAAKPADGVQKAILDSDAIVICPSNPFISVGPILAVPGISEAIRQTAAPVIAITPVIGNKALKGPAADMLRDLGHEVSPVGVARIYAGVATAFVLDTKDGALSGPIREIGLNTIVANTVMNSDEDKAGLARAVLEEASSMLRGRHHLGLT